MEQIVYTLKNDFVSQGDGKEKSVVSFDSTPHRVGLTIRLVDVELNK